ncbi:MAG: carcinine hydrolase/isopenicillin-N N-acyltransferase family protein [Planctomycetota bacterium]|jgi:hypothetical protein
MRSVDKCVLLILAGFSWTTCFGQCPDNLTTNAGGQFNISEAVLGSCTIFTVSQGEKVLFGNNEDYANSKTFYWVVPAGSGNYGGVYFGFDNLWAQGGINEKGLCYDWNALPPAALNKHSELPPFVARKIGFGCWALNKCATVEEAIALAKSYSLGSTLKAQIHFADATGDAVVISAGADGELAFIRKPPGDGYLVSTNFNRANSRNAHSYPCPRYDKAVEMLEKIEDSASLTADYVRSILDAVHVEGSEINTLYSNIFDLRNGTIYLYHWHQFDEVITLNVAELLARGSWVQKTADAFSPQTYAKGLVEYMEYRGRSKQGKSPLDELPTHIRRVTHFGQRADFSHDGKRILFLEKTFGDVYEVELKTGIIRAMTHRYYHEGYTRALYLANGDILLSGARKFDAAEPLASRSERNAELWVLKKDLSEPPAPLGENCSEGPAVSRKRMHVIWTQGGAFYSADIVYAAGRPRLAHKTKVLDKKDLSFETGLETQNIRPPDERELIFSAYGYQGTEVCGLDLRTGKVVNYSKAPKQYDEPEGIFPDGKHTLVECDKHVRRGSQYIDLYKLALDGSGRTERVTFFSDYPGYKASNPVVSDDGNYIAFQVARKGDMAGVGRGILIFDLEKWERMRRSRD